MGDWHDEQQQPEQRQRRQYRDGFAELNAGDTCPRCGDGVLFQIGKGPKSVTLRCFMCNTTGSHNPELGHQVVTLSPRETPTGFTLSRAQHEAQRADDPEEAAASNLFPEQGSGVVDRAPGSESG